MGIMYLFSIPHFQRMVSFQDQVGLTVVICGYKHIYKAIWKVDYIHLTKK